MMIRGAATMSRHRRGGIRQLPILLLSASTTTGLAGSSAASASASRPSNAFCDGCPPGRWPNSDPRWLASASRSMTCTPCAAISARSSVLAVPVLPSSTTTRDGTGSS
jgi:hypothetical protein